MKTFRLLESGGYLLALETTIISETFTLRQLREKHGKHVSLFAPADLFAGRKHNPDSADPVVLQPETDVENPFLYFDHDLGEFPASVTDEMPLLYPDKAARVCPATAIIKNEVVLCLNPEALFALHTEASPENFLLDIDQLLAAEATRSRQQSKAGHTLDHNRPEPESERKETAQSVNDDGGGQRDARPAEKSPASSTQNEDPVFGIISWISRIYEELPVNEKAVFGPENIPESLLARAALDDASLRYLIDQTVIRLQKRTR